MRRLCAIGLILAVATSAAAGDAKLGAARAKVLAPYLEETTFLIGRVDVTKLNLDESGKMVPAAAKKHVAEAKQHLKEMQKRLVAAGVQQVYFCISLSTVQGGGSPIVIAPAKDAAAAEKLVRIFTKDGGNREDFKLTAKGATLLAGNVRTLAQLGKADAAARPDLAEALAQSADKPIQVVIAPPTLVRQTIEEAAPKLPRELGGGSIKVLTRGLRWACLHLVPEPKGEMQLVVQCADEAAAKALHALARNAIMLANAEGQPGAETWGGILTQLRPKLKGDRVVGAIENEQFVRLVANAAMSMHKAADRMQSMNNLKQIGLAFHNYADTYGHFPTPHSTSAQNKPLLSWRVHVLPYVEQNELYKQFKLDEPWDSPHNKKLIARMPEVYASPFHPKLAKEGKTTYLVPTGKSTIFPGGKGVKITDVLDGTSNTILALAVDEKTAKAWTKPEDWEFDAKNPSQGLSKTGKGGPIVLMADGSVHVLPAKIDKETLRRMFMRNDGKPLQWPK